MQTIRLGIIGLGTVGTGVVKIIQGNRQVIESRLGACLEIARIADLDLARDRGISLGPGVLTADALAVIDDPSLSIVVELMGGQEPAASFILRAISNGKHVITANKALLATRGAEIFKAAYEHQVDLGFEASVCGGIPVIRAIREGLTANRINLLYGIMNGTANYILTKMTDEEKEFDEVLREAQKLGYAEADPSLDVSGTDTTHKLSILLSLIYGKPCSPADIYTEGITHIHRLDIEYARELGYRIKLLAIFKEDDGQIEARVHPTLIPADSLLSHVQGIYNAVFVCGDAVGATMFYGQGAGMMPTGSAVVSDIIDIARDIINGKKNHVLPFVNDTRDRLRFKEKTAIRSKYYLRFSAKDSPGVLSQISGVLAKYNISISSVIQRGRQIDGAVPIFMLIYEASEEDVGKALREIDCLPVALDNTVVIRIEDQFERLMK